MKKRTLIGIVLGFALITLGLVGAADRAAPSKEKSKDEKSLRKAAGEYAAAFNKGDLDKLLTFWAEDADFIDDEGTVTRGHEALAARLKENLAALKGSKISFEITQLRFPRPEVAVEDGQGVVTTQAGAVEKSRYNAVWIKTDGRWLLSSVRELPSVQVAKESALHELDWLIGEWTPDNKDIGLTVTFRWTLNKKFIAVQYVTKKEGEDMTVTKFVGWDPAVAQVRSWAFDSEGGFGGGLWSRQGNTWIIDAEGILPDGGIGSAINSIRFVNAKTFIWRSTDRQIDGVPAADTEVTFIRK